MVVRAHLVASCQCEGPWYLRENTTTSQLNPLGLHSICPLASAQAAQYGEYAPPVRCIRVCFECFIEALTCCCYGENDMSTNYSYTYTLRRVQWTTVYASYVRGIDTSYSTGRVVRIAMCIDTYTQYRTRSPRSRSLHGKLVSYCILYLLLYCTWMDPPAPPAHGPPPRASLCALWCGCGLVDGADLRPVVQYGTGLGY